MVVTLSPFKANMEFSDVLLPIAPFTETSGSFINAEGARRASMQSCVLWAIRGLPGRCSRTGQYAEIPGFDFETSQDVLVTLRTLHLARSPRSMRLNCPMR